MPKKRICIIVLFLCVSQINAKEGTFDFAWNLGSFGWGMNFAPNETTGGFKIDMLNFYIEHTPSNIGIKISPFNSWNNYSFSETRIQFINVSLYYNFFYGIFSKTFNEEADEDENAREGSTYGLWGPFVSFHYLEHRTGREYNTNGYTLTLGIQFSALIDSRIFIERSLPFGVQIINLELGFSFRHDGNNGFYFTLGTDILAVISLIAVINKDSR